MTVIELAKKRAEDCDRDGDENGSMYWDAYLEGALAQKEETFNDRYRI